MLFRCERARGSGSRWSSDNTRDWSVHPMLRRPTRCVWSAKWTPCGRKGPMIPSRALPSTGRAVIAMAPVGIGEDP